MIAIRPDYQSDPLIWRYKNEALIPVRR